MASLTPAETLREARTIEHTFSSGTPKLAILASFTSDLIHPYLVVEAHHRGWPLLPWHGPFGQFEQMIMQDSALWEQKPDVIWIAMRLQDVEPSLIERFYSLGPAQVKTCLEGVCQRLVDLVASARARTQVPIFVSNIELEQIRFSRPFDVSDPDGLFHLIEEANQNLARALVKMADAYLFDWTGVVNFCGAMNFTDPKIWHMAKGAIASVHMPKVANALIRSITGVLRPPVKCIVLDLDNTLWGGVLGDDGPTAIKIGGEYPGNVFRDFQSALLGYVDRGFLLAIASKNDESVVVELLRTHPEMLLRQEHFACIRANWAPKPQNMLEIAQTLNIGLDSLLFVDDNPLERAQMRVELPMVHVLELPGNPLGYLDTLRSCPLLDRPRVLVDDLNRHAMYRENLQRKESQNKIQTIKEYLQHLDMVAEVGLTSQNELERVHQLIFKTNQFNLTTRRPLLDELRLSCEDPTCRVAWLRLSDRFGDMGLVCVGILQDVGSQITVVDTFLMSCRVMGRSVEDAFLAYLAMLAIEAKSTKLRGIYIRTLKNTPVSDFYAHRGFHPVEAEGVDGIYFEKELLLDNFPWPEVIRKKNNRNG
jgi:FkbH-like protein